MKIYLIEDESMAVQLTQLLRLNSECVKLQWSRTIKNVPADVSKALETIEAFVEARVLNSCSNALLGELSEVEEDSLMSAIKKNTELRNSIGSGVVLAGKQADEVARMIRGMNIPKLVVDAVESGKNVILF